MELRVFENEMFGSLRTVEVDREPWFVAVDVCNALEVKNPSDALSRLDIDEKMTLDSTEGHSGQRGGAQSLNCINEAGLYSLVLSSRKPEAKTFKRWITHDVIPAIRKHGVYAAEQLLNDPDAMIAALNELKKERERVKVLQGTVDEQDKLIAEMKPKASYYDLVLSCRNAIAISVIAKDYGWSANRMNAFLHEKHVQYKQGRIWLLYQKFADHGYVCTNTHAYTDGNVPRSCMLTYWTQKGRLFIYELMKRAGHLPLMERNEAGDAE